MSPNFACLRKIRSGSVSPVRPLQCVGAGCTGTLGDRAEHSDCRFRQPPPLPQVREQERAGNAEARVAKGVMMYGRFTVKMTWAETGEA